jgi:hypothetical protein
LKLQADALINHQGAFGVLGYLSNCSAYVSDIVAPHGGGQHGRGRGK